MSDENNAAILREIIKTCVRKLGLLQKADAACCGITVGQCHTLVEIGRANVLSLNELSESLTLDKSTMSRTVDNLVIAGLVERQIDKDDRRYTKITLTEKGFEMVESINSSMKEYFDRVLSSIPKEKHEIVIEALPYLLTAVRDTEMCFDVRQVCSGTTQEKGGCNCE
ncbi:MarR family winged helix-turn-helix transcriptional regulator [Sporomusa sp.]|uniref:MarR family winged helix-turn-helix transcriptional regulator n=1 Tax=Sporomusa sp. TaxID=2078658 RepID=UPI002CB26A4C|nr:MarR family transcriptional regulator [Sporomusa sp.]HWR41996.1 MarR family transcriptional regulator [Sporomusa sp.]